MRLLVLLLILLNAVYYAWSHDLLRDYGFATQAQREPQRVTQQIRPEWLRIVSTQAPAKPEVPLASAPPELASCLQAGPFDATQAAALRARVSEILPDAVWSLETPATANPSGSLLRISPVDEGVRARLDALQPVLAGKPLLPCP